MTRDARPPRWLLALLSGGLLGLSFPGSGDQPRSTQPTWRSLAFVAAVAWLSVGGAVAPVLAAEELAAMDLGPPPQPLAAPDFRLPTLAGGKMALKDLRGKPILVHFWTTWCQPCKIELPLLEKFHREHKDRGLVVLAITVDASADVVRKYVAEGDYTFPVLLDPDYVVADQFRLRGLPGTFIVGRDGYIKARGHGPREWDSPAARKFADWLLEPR